MSRIKSAKNKVTLEILVLKVLQPNRLAREVEKAALVPAVLFLKSLPYLASEVAS